jgi:hypothetical protein
MSELLTGLLKEGSVGMFAQPAHVAACARHEHAQAVELDREVFDVDDPMYELTITVRAAKRAA